MKKAYTIPLLALAAGVAALILRSIQNAAEFDPVTGLPVPGGVFGLLLIGLLAAAGIALCLLVRLLPRETGDGPAFLAAFSTENPALLALPVTGILLLCLSGLLDLATGLGLYGESVQVVSGLSAPSTLLIGTGDRFSETAHLLLGVLSVASAAALFAAVAACRNKETVFQKSTLLLVPPLALVIRLVFSYRAYSINPALMSYYVELLALVLLTLAFYRLSSFGYRAGRTRIFCLYAAGAVILSLCAMADAAHLASVLLYPGCALILTGFLLLRLQIHSAA